MSLCATSGSPATPAPQFCPKSQSKTPLGHLRSCDFLNQLMLPLAGPSHVTSCKTKRWRQPTGTLVRVLVGAHPALVLWLWKRGAPRGTFSSAPHATYPDRLSSFPPGPKQDAEAAKRFILDMYIGMYMGCAEDAIGSKKCPRSRRLFSHYTCATDTQNIRKVFKDVRDSVLARYLDEINLL
ncbi:guanine nucleotide-binding protein subunit alpha-15 [Trichechus manatus latirostris]|uniref:Guanine nucleotide-binding protein subunit alpha-15 n=1 Tax=Trichechus manatus latirostris TaxID=127582 RepID=A0A2Y9R3I7_TRIMA|nr:guanine nucleotide-binding protein subunit alpha-15 [Trichechus manatus latirostris]